MSFSKGQGNTEPLVIVGGGGHAKVVVSIVRKLKGLELLGYTDLKDNGSMLGTQYLGTDHVLAALTKEQPGLGAVLGVGQVGLGRQRSEIWTRLQPLPLSFPLVMSPHAVMNEDVRADEGVVIMDGAVINCGVILGRGAIVNTNSTIEHDAVIGEWAHIAPGATVCGDVRIGEFSMVGAGATVIEGRSIAACCIVGAGATVIDDLTEPGVYAGSPARRLR
jgi:sugar O-acyltransferase (sialic acid O-acetyltransferase NeuD family)